jgi:P pilus assembly chaperone PapD
MTAFQAAVMLLASLLPQEAPRIDEQPKRVCLDAPRAIFQVENTAAEPILAVLRVERWSEEGDTAAWAVVQEDITQREARPKQVRNLKLDVRQRRNVAWELQKRAGPPALVTGRHRLVVTWSNKSGEPAGTVSHEFLLADCGY